MARLKFVQPLSEIAKQELHEVYQNHPNFRVRQRAHAMLLSAQGYTINQLQAIFQINRDYISLWIDRFNAQGIDGLDDLPRSGRPPIYTTDEIDIFTAKIAQEPRQIKQAQAFLETQTEKKSCLETLKRILKNSTIPGDVADVL
jgi:transposase